MLKQYTGWESYTQSYTKKYVILDLETHFVYVGTVTLH